MKKLITIYALIAASAAVNAAPLVTIGDELDLFFTGAVTGSWESNITYTQAPNKKDDYSLKIRLGAEADYGRNNKFKFNVKFYEDLTRYSQYSQFNSNLANVFVNASYTETVFKVAANFSYRQLKQNSSEIIQQADLVRRDQYNSGIIGTYDFSDKLFGEVGFNWFWEKFIGEWADIYSNQMIYTVPVSLFYNVTEKIAAGLTYQYRYTTFDGGMTYATSGYGNSRNDHFGGVTIRGILLPKLSATANAGVVYRSVDNFENETTFSFSATLGYELTEKVGLFARGFRDYGSGAQRQSQTLTGGEFGVNYDFSDYISSVASFTYQNVDYNWYDRNDDEYIFRAGLIYKPNKFIQISANYRYLDNASNLRTGCYNDHLVDLTFSVRY